MGGFLVSGLVKFVCVVVCFFFGVRNGSVIGIMCVIVWSVVVGEEWYDFGL